MEWTTLKFGKHEGKTLPQVLFTDPDWFFWAIEKKIFKSEALKIEADELFWKAQNILIPRSDRESYEVEYFIHPSYNTFSHFTIVPKDRPKHVGSSETIRLTVINMRAPRIYGKYEKSAFKRLLKCLKLEFFGDKSHRMNQARCEDFFNDDSKFAAK